VQQVNCALGDVPRERSVEGIRLSFKSNGGEFSEEVSGRVMFLALRPEVIPPAKAPQKESAPATADTPDNQGQKSAQILVNAVIVQVGTGTDFSGKPTYQALERFGADNSNCWNEQNA
jgi:hypothetical protein